MNSPATVRMSAQEVGSVPARVLAAAEMPVGCVGGAVEAVTFLEYSAGTGLALLDRDKESLLGSAWRAPEIDIEAVGAVVCRTHGESALFAGPALADWVSALAVEQGAAAMAAGGLAHPDYLPALGYRLAMNGLSGLVCVRRPHEDDTALALTLTGRNGWVHARLDLPGVPGAPPPRPGPEARIAALAEVRRRSAEWTAAVLAGTEPGPLPDFRAVEPSCRDMATCIVVAVDAGRHDLPATADAVLAGISERLSARYGISNDAAVAAARRAVLAEGLGVPRVLWSSLMAFADRALIPTSEQSRLGAG